MDKIKMQKAFIQIPILIAIVIFVIVSGITAGIVLHNQKQSKSSSLSASVSQEFSSKSENESFENNQTQAPFDEQKSKAASDNNNEKKKAIAVNQKSEPGQETPKKIVDIEPEYAPQEQPQTNPCDKLNCDKSDGCSGNNYLDHYCSNNSCVKTEDDCSDCSCSCGGYNAEESLENNNCDDGKDNDCDGFIDSEDSECFSQQKFIVLTKSLGGNITQNSKLTLANSPYIVTETVQVLYDYFYFA